jgi:hypothetical protein
MTTVTMLVHDVVDRRLEPDPTSVPERMTDHDVLFGPQGPVDGGTGRGGASQ